MKVILNADDFGRSEERNRAVNDSFQQGLISSAGLIVTGKHLNNAIEYINKGEYIKKIHLHINLSTSLRDGDPGDAPLTERMQKDTFFCKNGKFRPYKGLPQTPISVLRWETAYNEIVAQYKRFIEVTNGKADYNHVDFHLWYNLTWPVSVALHRFTRKYKIKSVRYIGMHQMAGKKNILFQSIGMCHGIKSIPSSNIDFFLSKRNLFDNFSIIELYSHPNYKGDVFLDDSPSYLKHPRQSMQIHYNLLKEIKGLDFISWEDV